MGERNSTSSSGISVLIASAPPDLLAGLARFVYYDNMYLHQLFWFTCSWMLMFNLNNEIMKGKNSYLPLHSQIYLIKFIKHWTFALLRHGLGDLNRASMRFWVHRRRILVGFPFAR